MEAGYIQPQVRAFAGDGIPQHTTNASGGQTAGSNVGTTDGVAIPGVFKYEVTITGLTAPATNEGTINNQTVSHSSYTVATDDQAKQIVRGNMRFNSMVSRLGSSNQLHELTVESVTGGATGGTVGVNAEIKFHVSYLDEPIYQVDPTVTGANAVKLLAAQGAGGYDFNGQNPATLSSRQSFGWDTSTNSVINEKIDAITLNATLATVQGLITVTDISASDADVATKVEPSGTNRETATSLP
jgi:hypothetical protein|tara:strand:- start:538 stop:1263 length:726 start_codon:yes stop_codon:yes gene_type:complete